MAQQLYNASLERVLSAKRKWGVSAMALTYRLRKARPALGVALHAMTPRHTARCIS